MSRVTVKDGRVAFRCPGCKHIHSLPFTGEERPNWTFNGDANKPTLSPSILATGGCRVDPNYHVQHDDPIDACDLNSPEAFRMCFTCHSFVRDGRIEFLSDCTHALAGQTVDLPEEQLWAG